MQISVTGASGHIGNTLCRMLIKNGHQVKALIHRFDKSLEGLQIEKIYGDILNQESVNALIEHADYVFHTAAIISIGKNPKEKIFHTNIEGTRNIIEACRKQKIRRLIHFSSVDALRISASDATLDENTPLAGEEAFFYNQSKAAGEKLVSDACHQGLNAVILSPSSVIGPYDFVPSLAGQMIIKLAAGKLPFVVRGGYHWVDVRDVAIAAVNAMDSGQTGKRYLLSSQWLSLSDVAEIICQKMKRRKPVLVPYFLARSGLPFINLYSRLTGKETLYTRESLNLVTHSPKTIDAQNAILELEFRPRPVKETIIDTLQWFMENGYIPL